jgi:hypothetical protein
MVDRHRGRLVKLTGDGNARDLRWAWSGHPLCICSS